MQSETWQYNACAWSFSVRLFYFALDAAHHDTKCVKNKIKNVCLKCLPALLTCAPFESQNAVLCPLFLLAEPSFQVLQSKKGLFLIFFFFICVDRPRRRCSTGVMFLDRNDFPCSTVGGWRLCVGFRLQGTATDEDALDAQTKQPSSWSEPQTKDTTSVGKLLLIHDSDDSNRSSACGRQNNKIPPCSSVEEAQMYFVAMAKKYSDTSQNLFVWSKDRVALIFIFKFTHSEWGHASRKSTNYF